MSDYVGRFSRIEQLPDLLDGPTSSQINRVALMWASLRAVLSDKSIGFLSDRGTTALLRKVAVYVYCFLYQPQMVNVVGEPCYISAPAGNVMQTVPGDQGWTRATVGIGRSRAQHRGAPSCSLLLFSLLGGEIPESFVFLFCGTKGSEGPTPPAGSNPR